MSENFQETYAEHPSSIHNRAMELCDLADRWKRDGDSSSARSKYREAMEVEAQAAEMCHGLTRGVLFRSAGWLAINAGRLVDAISMAERGLADPELEPWLKDELDEVIAKVAELLKAEKGPVR